MQTVISAFNDQQTAQRAMERLIAAGFSRDNVHIQAGYDDKSYGTSTSDSSMLTGSGSTTTTTAASANSGSDRGFFSSVGDFFSDLFGSDDTASSHAGTYSEAVRRGNTVLVVDAANEVEAERAADIMDELGAIDVDERATQWKAQGWNGFDKSAMPLSRDALAAERQTTSTMPRIPTVAPVMAAAMPAKAQTQTPAVGTTMNVVQEELQVGKRSVDRGGVRVVQRVSEKPVSEIVRLREERAVVERRPVDRVATAAEFETFKDGTIEVRESAEEAVVAKTARVIEEVVVGKDVQERTETITDTVRRKDVDIERFEGATGSASRTSQEHAMATDKLLGTGQRDANIDRDESIMTNKPATGRNS